MSTRTVSPSFNKIFITLRRSLATSAGNFWRSETFKNLANPDFSNLKHFQNLGHFFTASFITFHSVLEAQLFNHTNLYHTIFLIINNVEPQKSISKKYFLNFFHISLFFCPWGILSGSAHYIYRNSIVYTKGQDSIKVITTFNNSIIDIATNILLILFYFG